MAIKTHLADSAEPLVEGQKLLAICGAIVPDAAFVAQSEGDDLATSVFHMSSCYRCKKSAALMTHKYLYLLVSGEEQKQNEASA